MAKTTVKVPTPGTKPPPKTAPKGGKWKIVSLLKRGRMMLKAVPY